MHDNPNVIEGYAPVSPIACIGPVVADPKGIDTLIDAMTAAERSVWVRAIVLEQPLPGEADKWSAHAVRRLEAVLVRPHKPVITPLNGAVCDAVLAIVARLSHVRVSARSARFGFPDDDPAAALWTAFAALAGRGSAQLMRRAALTGEVFTADDGLQCGWLTEVVEDDSVEATAQRWAERFAALAPLAIQGELAAIAATHDQPFDQGKLFSFGHTSLGLFDADAIEGPLAFMQKRRPHFVGATFLEKDNR